MSTLSTDTKTTYVLCYINSFGEYTELEFDSMDSKDAESNHFWRGMTSSYKDVHWERRETVTVTVTASERVDKPVPGV